MTATTTATTKPTAAVRGHQKCASLSIGDTVDAVYVVSQLDQRTKKNNEPFFSLTLADATGTVGAIIWDNHRELVDGKVKAEDFVHVIGLVGEYNNALQMTLKRITKVAESDVDLSHYVPVSPRPRAEMEVELDALIESVRQPDCRRLLDFMFGDKKFRELYCTAPAAARIHQAYIHGLLEHTLAVVDIALFLGNKYKPYDRDLVITSGLLHDCGKIREYTWARTIGYSDEGRLMGHISIGAGMVENAINALTKQVPFSPHYRMHILHLILSHHGKLEFGSPITPKTLEAHLLHYADMNEAFLTTFHDAVRDAAGKGQKWTSFNKLFNSFLFSGSQPTGSIPFPPPATAFVGEGFEPDPREKTGGARVNPDDPG